jgi:long-chain acyl-CoA synthetase
MRPKENLSVRRFFAGKNILLTGSTGFLAKALAEKILRDLPEVGKLFLLIRPRVRPTGALVSAEERLFEELLKNSVFDRLRTAMGNDFEEFCRNKISCVEGDLTRERLGLDEEKYADLVARTDVVINSAATVVFDERLDWALEINTLSPRRMLALARKAGAPLVHISTAYVSGKRTGRVPEKLLSPLEAIDAQLPPDVPRPKEFDVLREIERLRELCRAVKADSSGRFPEAGTRELRAAAQASERRALMDAGMRRAQSLGWNDTYTYTKFLGEQLLYLEHDQLPTVIVRPSIIESSFHEPEPGWLDGLRMADPLIIGFGKGRLSDFPLNPNVAIDIIPADLVVNATLTAAAHIGDTPGGFDVIHVASANENPLTCGALYRHVREYFQRHPMTDRSGRPVRVPDWKFPTISTFQRQIRNRQLRPVKMAGFLVDGPLPLPGMRRWRNRLRLLHASLEQILYYADIYGPYTNLNCRFETAHGKQLGEALVEDEKGLFGFDARKVHWRRYIQDVHIPGLKRNILRLERTALAEEDEIGGVRSGLPARVRGVPRTLVELAAAGRYKFGAKILAEMRHENGQLTRLSYGECFERAGEWAKRLAAKAGVGPGDRVVLWSGNRPEWGLAYLAIARAIAVPLDSRLTSSEAAELTSAVEAKAVIVSPAILHAAQDAGTAFGPGDGLPPRLNLLRELEPHPGDAWPFPAGNPAAVVLRDPRPDSPASILFTSGTTLAPKGVILTHANFTANAFSVAEILEPLPTDHFLSVLPLHHAFEFTGGFICPQTAGATIHYLEALRGPDVLETMKRAGVTVMLGVPRLFAMFADGIRARIREAGPTAATLLAALDKAGSAAELLGLDDVRKTLFRKIHDGFGGKLRLFVSGGAALDPKLFLFFRGFGIPVIEGYGLTETGPILTVNPKDAAVCGSVGLPLPGVELRLREPNGEGIGEVLARGPNIMSGYWRNPEATAAVFEDGWFRTGDLGCVDERGYLHITGRLKDVIVTSSGKNVYPDEVEAALGLPAGVKEFCVVGLPNRSGTGEEVALAVVPTAPLALGDDSARAEISAAFERVARKTAPHCRPSRLEFLATELPKTTTLKVQRAKVRDLLLSPTTKTAQTKKALDNALHERASTETASDAGASLDDVLRETVRAAAAVAGLPPNGITPDRKLQLDLGIDSLGLVDLLGRLEMRFAVSIPESAAAKLFTIRDVVTAVEGALKTGGGRDGQSSFGRLWRRTPRGGIAALNEQPTLSQIALRSAFNLSADLIFSSYLPLECHGVGFVPRSGPYILAANHVSHLDTGAIITSVGARARNLHVLGAKDYFFNTSLKRWLFPALFNALPLDREERMRDTLALCRMVLDAGRALLIYPEGTRSRSGEVQPLKPGIGILGVELDVPVIPTHVKGTFQALPKGGKFPRPSRIIVRFGAPVDLSGVKKEFAALRAAAESSANGNGEERRMTATADGALKDIYRRAAKLVQVEIERLAVRAERAEMRRTASRR